MCVDPTWRDKGQQQLTYKIIPRLFVLLENVTLFKFHQTNNMQNLMQVVGQSGHLRGKPIFRSGGHSVNDKDDAPTTMPCRSRYGP